MFTLFTKRSSDLSLLCQKLTATSTTTIQKCENLNVTQDFSYRLPLQSIPFLGMKGMNGSLLEGITIICIP